jgi:hypothetical protein
MRKSRSRPLSKFPQNRHPERSASQIYRMKQRLWRGVEGPRRRLSYRCCSGLFDHRSQRTGSSGESEKQTLQTNQVTTNQVTNQGPNLLNQKIDKQLVLSLQISKFVLEGNALGEPSTAWAETVGKWLRANLNESDAAQFRSIEGFEEQKKYLLSLVARLNQPKPH